MEDYYKIGKYKVSNKLLNYIFELAENHSSFFLEEEKFIPKMVKNAEHKANLRELGDYYPYQDSYHYRHDIGLIKFEIYSDDYETVIEMGD